MISLIVLTVSSVLDLKKNQLKALKQIRATRSAANTIVLSMRFFLAKKKYYKTRCIFNPLVKKNSQFARMVSNTEGNEDMETGFSHLELKNLR